MATKLRRFVPDRGQRIAAIRHVVYEYGNLMAAGYYSIHGGAPWRTNCDDAFLLGCRKLDDFLMKENRTIKDGQELDDVLALDYLPANPARNWRLTIWTAEWRGAMNKQLTHIAYSRDKEWNHLEWVPQLEAEFNTAWWDFRETIADNEYRQEFEKQLAACQLKPGFGNIVLHRR